MSLGIVVKGTEGLALAADSRVTLHAEQPLPTGETQQFRVNYDNAKKIISFSEENHQHVAAITFGNALIGRRTAHSFVPEIEVDLPDERQSVESYATLLSEFYREEWMERMPPPDVWDKGDMNFVVAGYNEDDPYGKIYRFGIPGNPDPEEQNPGEFGITYGGETEIVNRLVKGMDPQFIPFITQSCDLEPEEVVGIVQQSTLRYEFPYEVLPLQDCGDLAILLVRTTIDFQGLAIGVRGVGGMIEAGTITRKEGVSFIQRKKLKGERRYNDHGQR